MASKYQLIHPGDTAWQAMAPDASAPKEVEPPFSTDGRHATVLALPAAFLTATPLRIEGTEGEVPEGMVEIQLEKLGLINPAREIPRFLTAPLPSPDESPCLLAVVLDPEIPDALCMERAEAFEASPRLLPFPENRIVIFRELGRLVVAVTSGKILVHFQMLASGGIDDGLAQEIQLMLAAIDMEVDLAPLDGVTLWTEAGEAEMRSLADALDIPVERADRPLPALPTPHWNLVPQRVDEMRRRTRSRQRTRKLAGALAAVVVLCAIALTAHLFMLDRKAAALQAKIDASADEVSELQPASLRWRSMELALNPDIYPLERLLQTSVLLPPQGVRLTVFEQRGSNLVIAGEASSTPAAIKFANDLSRSPGWAGYETETPQPKILANNSAQFRITARRMIPAGVVEESP